MNFLILADDLSGAADCAVGFVNAGLSAAVLLSAEAQGAGDTAALTVDTDSRRHGREQAADGARRALSRLRLDATGQRRVIKKIDSTLRGNWAAEVAALQPALGLALIAPAFPAAGRVVRQGQVFVHGTPLAETETWALEHAGLDASPVRLLQGAGLSVQCVSTGQLMEPGGLAAAIETARASACQALLIDAEDQSHLQALARQTLDLPEVFWVGSAGLSRELAAAAAAQPEARNTACRAAHAVVAPGPNQSVLTIVGSLSAVSASQVGFMAHQPGMRVHTVAPSLLRTPMSTPTPAGSWLEALSVDLRQGHDAVVAIGVDDKLDPAEGPLLARALARSIRELMHEAGGLVVTGGETARAMLESLDIGLLNVQAESEPGVVLSTSGGDLPKVIATKAGAFGHEQSLWGAHQAVRRLLSAR